METRSPSDVATDVLARPEISSILDLDAVDECIDPGTGATKYTTFYSLTGGDAAFFGEMPKPKAEITRNGFADALGRVPDGIIFPAVPQEAELQLHRTSFRAIT